MQHISFPLLMKLFLPGNLPNSAEIAWAGSAFIRVVRDGELQLVLVQK